MNKRLSGLLTMSAMLFAGSAVATNANAVEAKTTLAMISQDNASHIDRVLGELSRQHDGASSLVKSARQPTSLALSSSLLANDTTQVTNDEDVLERLTAVASNSVSKFKQTGLASWYGRKFHGRKTASGETFDMNGLTAAHRSLPLNCYVKVTNKTNGKSVVVKVNDRGPFHGNRVLDLSYGAAKKLGITSKGHAVCANTCLWHDAIWRSCRRLCRAVRGQSSRRRICIWYRHATGWRLCLWYALCGRRWTLCYVHHLYFLHSGRHDWGLSFAILDRRDARLRTFLFGNLYRSWLYRGVAGVACYIRHYRMGNISR